jgi:hypothetical protein
MLNRRIFDYCSNDTRCARMGIIDYINKCCWKKVVEPHLRFSVSRSLSLRLILSSTSHLRDIVKELNDGK